MAIGRLKLTQYLSVLRKYIPGESSHELHQTIDGIEEVTDPNAHPLFIQIKITETPYRLALRAT